MELPGGISQECASLLRSLLRRDPSQRLSFGSLFTHPFLYPPELSGGSHAADHAAPPPRRAPPPPPPPHAAAHTHTYTHAHLAARP